MSRLGDLILLERTRQKLTRKQVARKCGVSEGYIKDVEEGRRIIQDDQARRILKTLGTSSRNEAEFSLDEIAATVDLSTLAPQAVKPVEKKPEPKAEPAAKQQSAEEQSGIWLDALSSVLKPVPTSWMPSGVGAIIKYKGCTVDPVKLKHYDVLPKVQGFDGPVAQGRVYYDAFVLDAKKDGIVAVKTV